MKRLNIFLALAIIASAQIDKVAVDEKFEQIAKERVTIDDKQILRVSNPFIVDKVGNDTTFVFTLQAIVQNRAKINGRWYKTGEEIIGGFRIVGIKNGVVGLSDMNTYKELNLKDNKNVTVYKK